MKRLNEVLAEMRREVGDGEDTYCGQRIIRSMDGVRVRQYCDRIEAAWKRDEERAVEHATRHAEAVARDNCRDCVHNPKGKNYEGGNAAVMREACVNIAGYAQTAKCHTEDGHILGYLDQIEKWAKSAISAPARNCDRPECATSKAAQDVWRKEDGGKTPYYEWILAPAAERKGENDGR